MADIVRRSQTRPISSGSSWEPFRIMRDLLQWDPFREMERSMLPEEQLNFVPQFEVKETGDAYLFKADLPGVREQDLEVSLTGNRLAISGRREAERRDAGDTYYLYERQFGTFTRTFTLPEGVDPENVAAELNNGVLTLSIPKKPEVQPKKIELKGGKAGAGPQAGQVPGQIPAQAPGEKQKEKAKA